MGGLQVTTWSRRQARAFLPLDTKLTSIKQNSLLAEQQNLLLWNAYSHGDGRDEKRGRE